MRKTEIISLGIESTAHTIGVGIVKSSGKKDETEILANEFSTFVSKHSGMIPRDLAEHHSNEFSDVLKRALEKANISINNVDIISVSHGPGIGAPLSFGVAMAKYLAVKFDKPIIGVNHPYAHIKIAELFSKVNDNIIVYVSGGNTQILYPNGPFYEILGETLDMGVGNLLDSFARELKLSPPNAVSLSKLAENGEYIELPYTVKGLNMTFSGLFTAAKRLVGKEKPENIAYSLIMNAFSSIVEVTERALFIKNAKGIIACGGVAQSNILRKMLKKIAKEDNVDFTVPKNEFNRDNGAMIAYAGILLYKQFGESDIEKLIPYPDYRIDRMRETIEKVKK